jgi:hypothetical protein
MTESATIKTSIVLPAELHWQLKTTAAERRLSDTAAVREAIRKWIDGPVDSQADSRPAAAPPGDRWQKMLADVLSHGDREAKDIVQQQLIYLHRNIKPETKRAEKKA